MINKKLKQKLKRILKETGVPFKKFPKNSFIKNNNPNVDKTSQMNQFSGGTSPFKPTVFANKGKATWRIVNVGSFNADDSNVTNLIKQDCPEGRSGNAIKPLKDKGARGPSTTNNLSIRQKRS